MLAIFVFKSLAAAPPLTGLVLSIFPSPTALNFQLLTVLGLDKEGNLHGVYLNGKIFLSCRQNGQGDCNVESAESWYRVRDEPETITATEVPHIAETGLDHTDVPDRHTLTLKDGLGRFWGGTKIAHDDNQF